MRGCTYTQIKRNVLLLLLIQSFPLPCPTQLSYPHTTPPQGSSPKNKKPTLSQTHHPLMYW